MSGIYTNKTHNLSHLSSKKKGAYLKDVLGHAGEAVVSDACAAGAHADLSHLVCLAEIRSSLHPHHTHHSWGHTPQEGGK